MDNYIKFLEIIQAMSNHKDAKALLWTVVAIAGVGALSMLIGAIANLLQALT